jgi:hypothetical protein
VNKVFEAESIRRQRVRIHKSVNNFATRKESAVRNQGIYFSTEFIKEKYFILLILLTYFRYCIKNVNDERVFIVLYAISGMDILT